MENDSRQVVIRSHTQRDIAHLLGAHQTLVSELERGHQLPTLTQIVTLSLIYGRSFESLFSALMRTARERLQKRILHMPAGQRLFFDRHPALG